MVFRFAVLLALVSIIFGSPLEYSYFPHHHDYVHAYEVPSKGPPAPAPAPAPAPKPAPALPVYKHLLEHHEYEHEGPVEYEFAYGVQDDHTKDIKGQKESRKGDSVKGQYELIDSDGYKRVVEYTADDKNGFQAIVHRKKVDIVVPIPEPKIHKAPAPLYEHGPEPLYHAPAPIQHYYPIPPPPPAKYIYAAPAPAPKPAPPVAIVTNYVHNFPIAKVEPPVVKPKAPLVHTTVAPKVLPPPPKKLGPVVPPPAGPKYIVPEYEGSHVSFYGLDASYHY